MTSLWRNKRGAKQVSFGSVMGLGVFEEGERDEGSLPTDFRMQRAIFVLVVVLMGVRALSISHKMDYREKMRTGETVYGKVQAYMQQSTCWSNTATLAELPDVCSLRSEISRLNLAVSFTYCTLEDQPCVDLFPLEFW
jgi:hypothetical protein